MICLRSHSWWRADWAQKVGPLTPWAPPQNLHVPVWSGKQHGSESHWSQQELSAWNKSQLWRWKILQKSQVWLFLLKSHFPLSLKKKKITENLNSQSKCDWSRTFLLWTQELKGPSLSDFLPLATAFKQQILLPPPPWLYVTSQQDREGANLWGSEGKISRNSIEKAENCCPKRKLLFVAWRKKKNHSGLQRCPLKRWLQWLLSKLDMLGLCSSVRSKDPCHLGDCPWICRADYQLEGLQTAVLWGQREAWLAAPREV